MMISPLKPVIYEYLLDRIRQKIPDCRGIDKVVPVSGGDINQAYRLDCNSVSFFIKINKAKKLPGIFEAESAGLAEIAKYPGLKSPTVLGTAELDGDAVLLMDYLAPGKKKEDFWESFGRGLATMHHTSRDLYGWSIDNYMGSLLQSNKNHEKWSDFFVVERLEPQFSMACDLGYFDGTDMKRISKLEKAVGEYIPVEKPALVHGDLWSGNYLVDAAGDPVLIDPATYYGHREVDIAMMHLFGGFPKDVFNAYNDEYPLEKGWEERLDIFNLYPVLVHVNLFGSSYVLQVKHILSRFS